jgi:hypothetical protein
VFVRRVYLDLLGLPPTAEEAEAFLKNPKADKRAALIDALLEQDEHVDYWTMRWCDLLRVKSEFPINLWPNAVQAYQRWIREAVRANLPLDEMARQILTASGSNFRAPAVNFYRAVQGRGPQPLAAAVVQTWMGSRIESWPSDRRAGLEAFFSRTLQGDGGMERRDRLPRSDAIRSLEGDASRRARGDGALERGPAGGLRLVVAFSGQPLVRPRGGQSELGLDFRAGHRARAR